MTKRMPLPDLRLRILVQAPDIADGVGEPRGDLGRVRADGLHDRAAVGDDARNRCLDAVDHDVNEHAHGLRGGTAKHPGAADLADAIVESERAIAASAGFPSEDLTIERGRS